VHKSSVAPWQSQKLGIIGILGIAFGTFEGHDCFDPFFMDIKLGE
jgi:hypothetical protein